jgi:hypothetical protein
VRVGDCRLDAAKAALDQRTFPVTAFRARAGLHVMGHYTRRALTAEFPPRARTPAARDCAEIAREQLQRLRCRGNASHGAVIELPCARRQPPPRQAKPNEA